MLVNGTDGGDTINVSKTAAGTATTVQAGSGTDLFGNIDLTQIGTAGLTLHAGGNGVITEQRLYQLIRQSQEVGEHTFSIEFLDGGAQAYSFTFG